MTEETVADKNVRTRVCVFCARTITITKWALSRSRITPSLPKPTPLNYSPAISNGIVNSVRRNNHTPGGSGTNLNSSPGPVWLPTSSTMPRDIMLSLVIFLLPHQLRNAYIYLSKLLHNGSGRYFMQEILCTDAQCLGRRSTRRPLSTDYV